MDDAYEPYFAALDPAIDRALSEVRASEGPLTVLFSGGVDSSLLAWELRDQHDLQLLTIGLGGSPDLGAASSAAVVLRLPWHPVVIDPKEVDPLTARVGDLLAKTDRVTRTVLLALALAFDHTPPAPVVLGQGIDELFLGYAHFRGLRRETAAARADLDLARLLDRDWPLTRQIARELSRVVAAPYLDAGFVAAARSVPIDLRLPQSVPKAFFRAWAAHRGLPSALTHRPKRALQYGSGIDRLVRRRRP
jgi:asparagine synthase (glutamine-hydrolysing)